MVKLTSTEIDALVGKRIQLKRKEHGFSAEKLSDILEISQQQLSRYERGVNKINVFYLVGIANIFQVPIGYFFADCVEVEKTEYSELDQCWHNLTNQQKQAFIELTRTFLNN